MSPCSILVRSGRAASASRGPARHVDRRDVGGRVDPGDGRRARRAAHEHGRAVPRGRIMNARATAVRRSTRIGVAIRADRQRLAYWEYSMATATGSGPPISRRASTWKSPRRNSSAACFPASGSACTAACRTSTASQSTGTDGLRIGVQPPSHARTRRHRDVGNPLRAGAPGQYAVRILGITGRTRAAVSSGNRAVDDALIDRREEPRLPARSTEHAAGDAAPGMSGRGGRSQSASIQVQSARPLRPGSRVLARGCR